MNFLNWIFGNKIITMSNDVEDPEKMSGAQRAARGLGPRQTPKPDPGKMSGAQREAAGLPPRQEKPRKLSPAERQAMGMHF